MILLLTTSAAGAGSGWITLDGTVATTTSGAGGVTLTGPPVPVFSSSGAYVMSRFTTRLYASLPETYRNEDQPLGSPLLGYLSLLGDQAGEVEDLLDRVGYVALDEGGLVGDTSDLVNPKVADTAWLPWLGQLVGVKVPQVLSGQAARDAIAGAVSGFQVGTKAAIAAAAASALTGSRYVKVYDHSIAAIGDGGQWDVMLVTRTSETPNVNTVLDAVQAKNAKPAGVVLHAIAYSATYEQTRAATTDTYAARQAKWPLYQDASDYLP